MPTIGVMRNQAIDAATSASVAVAGSKSAATAVTTGLSTAVVSILDGINWVTLIGISITILTFWMTWYFKNDERKDRARSAALERADYEQKKKYRDIQISLMLAGQNPDKLPKTESQLGDLQEQEAANG